MYQIDQRMSKKIIAILCLIAIIISTSGCTDILDTSKSSSNIQVGQNIELEVIEQEENTSKSQPENVKIEDEKDDKSEEIQNLVPYNGAVQHIFFHPLIAYPELAFDGDAKERGFNDYFVTIQEFERIIQSLYEKNYILIDINMLIQEKKEGDKTKIERSTLMIPEGKKPLIISIDDMNYYDYMRENGTIYKLILDDEGNIATYSIAPDGEEKIAYDNEIIPLLDKFVESHTDFSLDGTKGVIALTGFEGVLGYRTNEIDSPNYQKEKESALAVIEKLKENGWTFASHGYGHRDAAKISLKKLIADTNKWRDEVGSLVGPTKVYIYPYGSRVLPGDSKFQALVDAGFNILCAVGSQAYEKMDTNALMQDRRHIDGIGLIQQRERFLDLFDSYKIIDYNARPDKYIQGIKGEL